MSLSARAMALQGLTPLTGGSDTVFITGEPSAEVLQSLAARIDTALGADLRKPRLSAHHSSITAATLRGPELTAEAC